MPRFGPFEIVDLAGRGGMGVVYRARHLADDVDVAIKVLAADGSLGERAFRREAEAIARLVHPCIVAVHDFGWVPADATVGLEGVRAGAPYLVLDYLPGPTLGDRALSLSWDGLRGAALAVLHALAHAHARGIVHGDLKPANVLSDRDGRWLLADFGLSSLLGRDGRAVGTPPYMAPEQLQGRWWDIGAEADLYALGVSMWQAVCGTLPRHGEPSQLLTDALSGRLEPFRPRLSVPAGLRAWLERLLGAAPDDRFPCAADAACALASLGPAPAPAERGAARALDTWATYVLDAEPEVPAADVGPLGGAHAPEFPRPTVPAQPDDLPPPRGTPSNLGLGLWGLRPVPLVGRVRERARLWEAVRELCGGGVPTPIVVRGVPGIGRTALVRWLGLWAAELGVAEVWAPEPEHPSALERVVRRMLRVPDEGPALARLLGVRTAHEPLGVREALRGWLVDGQVPGTGERQALVVRLLRIRARRRPQVWVVDDLGRSADAAGVAARLTGPGPWWLGAVGPDDDLPEGAEALELPPVRPEVIEQLLERVLHLEGQVAREVARAALGVPGAALDIVAAWVDEGLLVPGAGGYTVDLARAARARAPGFPGAHAEAFELAATLGLAVDADEWEAACAEAELEVPWSEVTRGVRIGALRRTAEGWRFARSSVHAGLLEVAAQSGRDERWHRCCAAVVSAERHPERAGRHLGRMGDAEGAFAALRAAARLAMDGFRNVEALRLIDEALSHPGPPSEERANVAGWRAWLLYQERDLERAASLAAALLEEARAAGWHGEVGSALHTLGAVAAYRGEAEQGIGMLLAAAEAYSAAGQEAYAVHAEGAVLTRRPNDEALLGRLGARARSTEPRVRAAALGHLAKAHLRSGRLEAAAEAALAAVAEYRALGSRSGLLVFLDGTSSSLRRLGRLDEAEACIREALDLVVDDASLKRHSLDASLGLIQVQRGQYGAALVRLTRTREVFDERGLPVAATLCRAGLLVVRAGLADGPAYDLDLAALSGPQVAQWSSPDDRTDEWVALAGRLWSERGDAARAEAAVAVAEGMARAISARLGPTSS